MSNPIVILKNTTLANLKYKGIVIKHTVDRDHFRQVETICDHPRLNADIDAGNIVVNDGTNDLTAAAAKLYICSALFSTYIPDSVSVNQSAVPFDSGLAGFADSIEFGETGRIKNKFVKSSYNAHTSLDSTVVALTDGQVVHATLSTEENPENSWFVEVIIGATKSGATVTSKAAAIAATTADVGGTYDGTSKDNGKFDPIDLTSDAAFDGVPSVTAFIVGDRILVKDQTDAKQNGIYEVSITGSSGKIKRADDFDEDIDVIADVSIPVDTGTVNAGTVWSVVATGDIDVDNIDFVLQGSTGRGGGSQIGTDLEKTAGQLDKVYTSLTGFNFSAGDRISLYLKEGTGGTGEAVEPVIRLFLQYT